MHMIKILYQFYRHWKNGPYSEKMAIENDKFHLQVHDLLFNKPIISIHVSVLGPFTIFQIQCTVTCICPLDNLFL